ncbi:hypothetical protein [Rhodococcus sp. AW25M09]|uniref:hypothetical protein n=1 Tax=Rhodococcus sp. AW25M09 TaxID=1268303 RepID=UPI0005B54053|nr:hypothetical protein [Rhodococcus sp. AW25M09]
MTLSLTVAFAVAVLSCAVMRSRVPTPAWARARTIAGPDTLEELFAARYARGDIDRAQYTRSVDLLAAQLHFSTAPAISRKKNPSCAS